MKPAVTKPSTYTTDTVQQNGSTQPRCQPKYFQKIPPTKRPRENFKLLFKMVLHDKIPPQDLFQICIVPATYLATKRNPCRQSAGDAPCQKDDHAPEVWLLPGIKTATSHVQVLCVARHIEIRGLNLPPVAPSEPCLTTMPWIMQA